MTRSEKTAARIEAEALADRLARDYSEEILQELRKVLKERLPRSPGRPEGSGKDDSSRLERAAELLESGDVDEDEAIKTAAREDPGKSEANTRRRLVRKLPDFLAARELDEKRLRKQEILEAAFAEDVEVWDL